MRKNKLYFFIAILTIIFLFSFAALCNQCGTATEEEKLDVGEEEAAAEEEEAVVEEAAAEEEEVPAEEEEEEVPAEEEEEEEEAADEEKEAPTIKLETYEGPTPADGICCYRVKAIVTGKPAPTVEFSKDDSHGAWGSKKVQVNLNDPGEIYTLTATATNSEGSDTDSIELSWGCPEPEPEITEIDVPVVVSEGGYIEWGGIIMQPHDSMFAGDSVSDKYCRGFMSFDITGIAGATVTDVTLTLGPEQVWGDPTFLGSLWIDVVDWGAGPLVMADYNIGYVGIESFNDPDITCTHSKLKAELQKAIDDGKSRFRIRIRFTTQATDSDNQWDGWDYLINEAILKVAFTAE